VAARAPAPAPRESRENEPGTPGPALRPRHPVPPLAPPDPLEQVIRQEAEAVLRAGEPDATRLLALTRRLGAETTGLRPPLAVA
jgi:hypothetical protein